MQAKSEDKQLVNYEWCFDEHESGTLRSAQIIVPMIMQLVKPSSVIDIGCGRGTWLQVFKTNGVRKIYGIGSPTTDLTKLQIDRDAFIAVDIDHPFEISERFDLAVCLEVVEHLTPKAGRNLIRVLTDIAPVVLFSAALPGQSGIGHINEQWPSYWQDVFKKYGFRQTDPVRPFLYNDERVLWWYRQNIYLYVSQSAIEANDALKKLAEQTLQLTIIHSGILNKYSTFSGIVKELLPAFLRAVRQRI